MQYKVLITTSGVGSRLGDITKYTNKALVPIGDKPAISYIIENYPKNIEFVITVGYFAEHVKDFLLLAYPDRKFTFVEIDKYKGEGSSLGYSMLCAKKYLNTPFIFHACDTLIEDKIPVPSKNWIMGFKGDGSSLYASFNVNGKYVEQMMVKGFLNPDFLHVGLVGIKDYRVFFNTLEELYKKDPNNKELSDVKVINNMLLAGTKFSYQQVYEWYDTGNVESLQRIRNIKTHSTHILEKDAESIFFFDKFVIKFFFDKTIIDKRYLRANILKDKVPKVEIVQGNFMKYKYVKGELFSDFATPSNFDSFLNWAEKKLWIKTKEVSDIEFKKVCYEFYFTKSQQRIKKFLNANNIEDKEYVINGEKVPVIKELFSQIDFDWLTTTEQKLFHGDFILDNIIKTKKGFCLLDWRQDFGGLLKSGDQYYDFAKLNHNLTVNHAIVLDSLFTIDIEGNKVYSDILRKDNLVKCQEKLFLYLKEKGYDIKKVKVLTAIIWLNMAPLHLHPFNNFLFFFGKLNLWRALNEK